MLMMYSILDKLDYETMAHNLIYKEIAFINPKTKMVIFCQTPTKAAVYSFKTMDNFLI